MTCRAVRTDVTKLLRHCLIHVLGGRCEECGATERLEVDHKDGAGWSHRRMSSHQRVMRYVAEYRAGIPLRVLCRSCNAKDGALRGQRMWWHGEAPVPF